MDSDVIRLNRKQAGVLDLMYQNLGWASIGRELGFSPQVAKFHFFHAAQQFGLDPTKETVVLTEWMKLKNPEGVDQVWSLPQPKSPLSVRRQQVLSYALMGFSDKQIAGLMSRAEQTIANHLQEAEKVLFSTRGHDRICLAEEAFRMGYINIPLRQSINTLVIPRLFQTLVDYVGFGQAGAILPDPVAVAKTVARTSISAS